MKATLCCAVLLSLVMATGCDEDPPPDLRRDCRSANTQCSPGFVCERIGDGSWDCLRNRADAGRAASHSVPDGDGSNNGQNARRSADEQDDSNEQDGTEGSEGEVPEASQSDDPGIPDPE